MSVQVQHRRGTAAAGASFIGAEGEIGYLTDQKRLVAHDSATPGGIPMARLDEVTAEVMRQVGNADFPFQITDRLVAPNATFSAPRTGTLPLANSVAAGRTISFFDALPAINGANVLTVARTGTDTINGATSYVCTQPRGRWDFVSDGVSKWSVQVERAPLASPALTGTPTAPTASAGTNTTQLATTAFVKAAIEALIASAPGALDTLNELAAALGNDANFAATMTAALAGKQASLGFTPVRQGGGAGQGVNTIRAGWNATLGALTAFADSLDLGRIWTDYNAPISAGFAGEARLPNGLSLKWGALGHVSADYVHVFPNAFVTSCWEVVVTPSNRGIAHIAVDHDGITASGFTVRRRIISLTGDVTAGGVAGWYFAIGN